MDDKTTIEQAAKKLQLARERYDSASHEASSARNRETDALNALNAAQKEFDEAVAEVRKAAPINSEWQRSRQRVGIAG